MAELQYLQHTTRDGERWDQLAYRYYGDPHRYEEIVRANPDVPIRPILPSGVRLLIPVAEPSDRVPLNQLPPWKR
jgi:phage tail protein X